MNWKVPVYKDEADLGLAEAIQANCSIAYEMPVKNAEKIRTYFRRPFNVFNMPERALATNLDQLDLYYFASILVSTNWNVNDDVFGREEVWNARKTPEDKPINIEHRHDSIVGHITNVIAVDSENLQLIDDDTAFEDLPKSFHLVTGGVIYVALKPGELQEKIDDIIDKIEAKEEYVSMECLFKTFDYALKYTDGSTRIVARNDETSFLTKHLRAYGGDGKYNGMKLGRFPRQLIFSGKGLTTNPANRDENGPISIIFDSDEYEEIFESTTAGVIDMSKELEAQVADLSKNLKDANEKLEAALANATSKGEKIVELEKAVADANKSVDELGKAKADLEKKVTDGEAAFGELNKKFTSESRVNSLVASGHSVDSAKALVEKFADLNDAMFANVVELAKPASKPVEKPAEASEQVETEDDEETPDESLESAQANKDENLNNASAADQSAVLSNEIASYLGYKKEE